LTYKSAQVEEEDIYIALLEMAAYRLVDGFALLELSWVFRRAI